MSNSLTVQKSTACQSCPWTRSNPEYYFPPEKLKKSIVDSLDRELLHTCHFNHQNFCTGYLSFVEQNIEGGLMSLTLGRIALEWKIIERALIPILPVFNSVQKMLDSHQKRMNKFIN
jgi:Family of unknown function (DUF6283)